MRLDNSQACYFNRKKHRHGNKDFIIIIIKQVWQINMMGFKIPTGGRQTSWLFTNMNVVPRSTMNTNGETEN